MTAPQPDVGRLPEAVLRPATANVFETTVEQLATAIRLGVFVDGEQLPPERELSERLGVSRNTLRDAIAALRDSGLVTTRRGRGGGTVVTYVTPEPGSVATAVPVRRGAALADALDFRRIVEPGAAWLAARQELAGDQRAWLAESAAEVWATVDTPGHRIADSRFHLAVATLSGSPMVIESVTRAQAALGELLAAIPVLPRNITHSCEQHDAVVDAVLRGDAEAARAAMEEHCDATSALLRGLLG
ncbi:GntR family transcriptional regulator [Knoellia flava TL1]|uniref:GntR family transcriptional regulator n=2 Tax=Knoellia flava TaxID=913969 RepID=A0A8H9FX00_9MICO|nr:FCD domain-containing protein [Knoellia flava]KGN28799.1 GntR family transcriptional regulator [Knoellia flava TL1]GGB85641.1 GntR family transcriptional regulator [Knoellia flava]